MAAVPFDVALSIVLMRIRTRYQTIINLLDNTVQAPYCGLCWLTIQKPTLTNTCLHQFCFDCLAMYTIVLTVCPICYQPYQSVLSDIRAPNVYCELTVAEMRAKGLEKL